MIAYQTRFLLVILPRGSKRNREINVMVQTRSLLYCKASKIFYNMLIMRMKTRMLIHCCARNSRDFQTRNSNDDEKCLLVPLPNQRFLRNPSAE